MEQGTKVGTQHVALDGGTNDVILVRRQYFNYPVVLVVHSAEVLLPERAKKGSNHIKPAPSDGELSMQICCQGCCACTLQQASP